jgi:hypothetical protein
MALSSTISRHKTIVLSIACLALATIVGFGGYMLVKHKDKDDPLDDKDPSARHQRHKGKGVVEAEARRRRGARQRLAALGRPGFREPKARAAPEVVMARLRERERWFNTLPPDPNRTQTEASQQQSVGQMIHRMGFVVTSIECHTGACRIWLEADPQAPKQRPPPTQPIDRIMKEKWHWFHYMDGAEVRTLMYTATTGTLPDISNIQAATLASASAAAPPAAPH